MLFGCSEAPFSRLGRLLEAFWSVLEMFWRRLWVLGLDSCFQETQNVKKSRKINVLRGPREEGTRFDPPTIGRARGGWGEGREEGLLLC